MISNNVPLKKNNITKSIENTTPNTIVTVNPATEEIIKEYRLISKDEITTSLINLKKLSKNGKRTIKKERAFFMPLQVSLKRKKKG